MTDSKPRNCRHCNHMVCGDANWCSELETERTDGEIRARTDCALWEWNQIDALTLEDPEHAHMMTEKRERELHEKRMRGDWS